MTATTEAKNTDFTQSFDGMVWAKAFIRTAKENNWKLEDILDEGLLVGWFANAIMRGYDEANRRRDSKQG